MESRIYFVIGVFLFLTPISKASWGSPGLGQYHIQTDEGPERFFRYQTDSGQYRKEKRLQDGTVIGTDAWIDALGYLRQKDYIADNQGYRILKSKTVYVGKGQPIEEAIRSLKRIPQGGTLLQADLPGNKKLHLVHSTTTTTTVAPTRQPIHATTATPSSLYYDHPSTPSVFIRHHSQPLDGALIPQFTTPAPPISTTSPYYLDSTISSIPSTTVEPPYQNTLQPIAVYPPSSTPSPVSADYGPPIAVYPSSVGSTPYPDHYSSTPANKLSLTNDLLPPLLPSTTIHPDLKNYDPYLQQIASTTARPLDESYKSSSVIPLNSNDVDVQPLYTRPKTPSRPYSPYSPQQPQSYNNKLGSGYDPQFPQYDGVSLNNNGFRYYLPRQYHEEESLDPEHRAGSFGYIDPFGIRRVIYYNTAPETGFVHRKNNRYVGFNATPYDPRPL